MIPLADMWWVQVDQAGVWLVEVRKVGRAHETHRHGPFTSPAHALQQRKVEVPKAARAALRQWIAGLEAGRDFEREAPAPEAERKSGP